MMTSHEEFLDTRRFDGTVVVAAIVLYRTPLDLLERCIRSLMRQHLSADAKIVLAFRDNDCGSTLPAVAGLIDTLGLADRVILWDAGDNVGFGRAHNAIFAACRKVMGDRAWLHLCVNPDSIYHHRAVSAMVAFAAHHGFRGLFEARQFPREHPKPYDKQDFRTNWCSGCALLIPSSVYAELGGFCDDFFMYCEDVDLSWRTRLAGMECRVVPQALVQHDVARKGRDNDFERRHMIISGYKLARRYGGAKFAKAMGDMMRELLSPEELRQIAAWDKSFKPVPVPQGCDIPTFDHQFTFAQARW
ncbi:MAG: glycosyltransferase family 2 protein [Candidatus Sericytochromatia bacterium]|nr:glycosyltransferase family 2 protein [Candidatus Sericytochromatia bacterium]